MTGRSVDLSISWYARHPRAGAPIGNRFASAAWLVTRHPVLHRLAYRVPSVVDPDGGDVLPWVLADALAALDDHDRAWHAYRRRHREPSGYGPQTDDRHEAWLAAGPRAGPAVQALAVMSRTEVVLLRDWLVAVAAYLRTATDGWTPGQDRPGGQQRGGG